MNVAELSVVTHMHVAGSIHADVSSAAPVWLDRPTDANALVDGLWSGTTVRGPGGEMHVGGLPVSDILAQAGSPVYVIDEIDFRGRALTWAQAFAGWKVYYAGKSFLSGTIARWVFEEGLNLDVCSLGELTVALRAGFDPARIGLHGNNKSEDLLRVALQSGVGRIIIDSADEIARLERLGSELGVRPDVLIRVTTGVEAHTHEYIATAHEDQKFGFSIAGGQALVALVRCQGSAHLNLVGLHSHIGSQIFDTNGFEVAARRTLRLMSQFKEATGVTLPELDLGGASASRTRSTTPRPRPPISPTASPRSSNTSAGPSVWTSRCCLSNPAERSAALPAQRSTRSAPSRTSNSAAGSPGATSASTAA